VIIYFSLWISAIFSDNSFSLFYFYALICCFSPTISVSNFLFTSCWVSNSPCNFLIFSSASARDFCVAASYLPSSPDSWPPYAIRSCNRLISVSRLLIDSSRYEITVIFPLIVSSRRFIVLRWVLITVFRLAISFWSCSILDSYSLTVFFNSILAFSYSYSRAFNAVS
jgi:hypothetical protein